MPTINIANGASGASGSHSASAADNPVNETRSDGTTDARHLQSKDQATLLSAIDRLRREHIDADISIPQIVVCGDQSSGKSSVLQTIAGVPFPVDARTTTRFATEVILRQSPHVNIDCKIIPAADRSQQLKTQIESFQKPDGVSKPEDFERLITAAKEHLQNVDPQNKFWKDWLRAEVTGPQQPHLTLVDLPGIIQYEHEANAATGDKDKIKQLVLKYLRNSRTIVLAVLDAQNNLENQGIFELARNAAKDLALGVITKPDQLVDGSDLQRNVIGVANNKDLHLRLGWHILRNLAHEDQDRTAARRNEVEHQFFVGGEWSQLSRRDVGVDSLRKKLSEQLFRSIAADLPDLISEISRKLQQCKSDLNRLGPSRATIGEQKVYLSGVLEKLRHLIEAALEGDYGRSEFADFFDGTEQKGLRDAITNDITTFATKMRDLGKQYHMYARAENVDVLRRYRYAKLP